MKKLIQMLRDQRMINGNIAISTMAIAAKVVVKLQEQNTKEMINTAIEMAVPRP